jgi:hypothetical protein
MLLVLGLFGWLAHQGTNSGTVRIHFRFKILHPFAADSTAADSPYLRQITECAADLVSDQGFCSAQVCSFVWLIRGRGSLPRSPNPCAISGETAGFTPLSSEMVPSEQPSCPSPDEAFRNLTIRDTGRQLECWLW